MFDVKRVLLANGTWYDVEPGTLRFANGGFTFESGTARYTGPASSVLAIQHSDTQARTKPEPIIGPERLQPWDS